MTPAMREFYGCQVARRIEEFARAFYEEPEDPAFAEIEAARERLDAGWKGFGGKPSDLAVIGYCVCATNPDRDSGREFLDNFLAPRA